MDRRSSQLTRALLALCLSAALVSCRSAAPASGPAERVWTAATEQRAFLLATEPPPCDMTRDDVAGALTSARRGELMFSNPFLLGGQAARSGLSCASCHVNGRGNPAFMLSGISGPPGTADTTHGFFGPIRDDGVFNPVPIPDLSLSENRRLNRSDPLGVATFLRAQIAEEFEGTPPSDSMLRDLAAFLAELDELACTPDRRVPLSSATDLRDAADAFRASKDLALPGNPDREGYALAARHALGRIHARYPGASHSDLRATLEAISRDIASDAPVQQIENAMETLRVRLIAAEPRSLYAQEVLSDWMPD